MDCFFSSCLFGFLFQNHVSKRMRPSLASQVNETILQLPSNAWTKIWSLKSSVLSFAHRFGTKSALALKFQLLFTLDIASAGEPAYSKKPQTALPHKLPALHLLRFLMRRQTSQAKSKSTEQFLNFKCKFCRLICSGELESSHAFECHRRNRNA